MSKKNVRKSPSKKTLAAVQAVDGAAGATIKFYGMCGWLASAGCVLMPNRNLSVQPDVCEHCGHDHSDAGPNHIMSHQTRLAIRANAVDRLTTTWLPDEVLIFNNEEICVWNLDGLDLNVITDQARTAPRTISPNPPQGAADFDTPGTILNLGSVHPESALRADWKELDGCARVWLSGGELTGMYPQSFLNAAKNPTASSSCASYLSWRPAPGAKVTLGTAGKYIILSTSTSLDPDISITNAATKPGQHFSILYSLLTTYCPPMISPAQLHAVIYPSETCKPPAQVPEP
jgi:hypothetical protein